MKITCTGRKVNLKDAFEERVERRFAKLDKFFSSGAEAQITVTVEKDWQTVEITVRDRGLTCRAEKSNERMEEAFDSAAELLERRILKNRKRLDSRMVSPDLTELPEEESDETQEDAFRVIREKHFSCKPSTIEEAILNMELLGHTFYLFRDADTDEIHVVYARKDGSYGVLIPER
ncbi:MAG: ribosome-associated translation inhibitor RaiA [Ruthenibacterium sp.]